MEGAGADEEETARSHLRFPAAPLSCTHLHCSDGVPQPQERLGRRPHQGQVLRRLRHETQRGTGPRSSNGECREAHCGHHGNSIRSRRERRRRPCYHPCSSVHRGGDDCKRIRCVYSAPRSLL